MAINGLICQCIFFRARIFRRRTVRSRKKCYFRLGLVRFVQVFSFLFMANCSTANNPRAIFFTGGIPTQTPTLHKFETWTYKQQDCYSHTSDCYTSASLQTSFIIELPARVVIHNVITNIQTLSRDVRVDKLWCASFCAHAYPPVAGFLFPLLDPEGEGLCNRGSLAPALCKRPLTLRGSSHERGMVCRSPFHYLFLPGGERHQHQVSLTTCELQTVICDA